MHGLYRGHRYTATLTGVFAVCTDIYKDLYGVLFFTVFYVYLPAYASCLLDTVVCPAFNLHCIFVLIGTATDATVAAVNIQQQFCLSRTSSP